MMELAKKKKKIKTRKTSKLLEKNSQKLNSLLNGNNCLKQFFFIFVL